MATILIVDDDKGIRTLMKMLLESAGHTALIAASGEAAMQFDIAHVTLIAVDYRMGEGNMNGIEFIQRVRALPYDGVIISMSSDDVEAASLAAGATCFFDKYSRGKSLQDTISSYLA